MKRFLRLLSSAIPFCIIGGLLYAGIFIKPKPVGAGVRPPVLSQRDAFYGVAVPGDAVIWAVGRNGKIVRSDNDGRDWAAQQVPTHANLQAIAAWDGLRAIAVGNSGSVLTTADGGKTWTAQDKAPRNSEQQKYIRVRTGAGGEAWVVGEFGLVLATRDFGATWKSLGRQEDVAWNDIAVGSTAILTVGEFGRMRRSTDAGVTWQDVASPVKSSLISVAARADGSAVAVGLEGVILVSRDGGATWHRASSGTSEHLLSVTPHGDGWFVAGDQGIYLGADSVMGRWTLKRLAERVYAWHTDAQSRDGDVYLAGATLSTLASDGRFTQFNRPR